MRILAIETSELVGSVAALAGSDVLREQRLPPEKGTAQSLAPALKDLLLQVGWRTGEIQGGGVTIGPGSFTGLRVGVTTAKALAYAAKADVAGIDTLEAIAAVCPAEIDYLAIAIDAQRGQAVSGVFRRGPDGWFLPTGAWQLADLDVWLAGLPPGIALAGPVLRGLSRELPQGVRVLDPQFWLPTAAAVGRLAARRFARGERDDVWSLAPRYYRRSAAEERWERKHQGL
jgi:tRNA threonylcarbamoyladenosine biosynthesis protein TsaB